jgi:hypothetical protein
LRKAHYGRFQEIGVPTAVAVGIKADAFPTMASAVTTVVAPSVTCIGCGTFLVVPATRDLTVGSEVIESFDEGE